MATPMHGKLCYVSKCNNLVQLVVQVKYHVNIICSLRGRHTHTETYQCRGQKQFQETRRASLLLARACFNKQGKGIKTRSVNVLDPLVHTIVIKSLHR